MPRFTDDDVTNFLITEALVTRGATEQKSANKDRERKDWMKNHQDWASEAGLTEGGGR
jgi:hypothetical protein